MATTSTKGRPENQSLTRSRSLGRKPKAPGSLEHNANSDGSDHKTDKPLPNYLKPTISSRPDPVKFLKKGHSSLDESQKLLRRRSFDRPPSSLSSPSTSSPRLQKSLNISPGRPRDRPSVPRDKPVTGRSSSFHGSKTAPRGGGVVKSPPVGLKGTHGTKKSGLSTASASLHSKTEGSSVSVSEKTTEKEIIQEWTPQAPALEEEHEKMKVETDVQVSDDRDEPQSEDTEVQAEFVQSIESSEGKNDSDETDASLVLHCPDTTKEEEDEINKDKMEQKEETEEPEGTLDDKGEREDDVQTRVDKESSEALTTGVKEGASGEESTEENNQQEKENESRSIKVETSETKAVVGEAPEGTKRQVVQGKKESPSAYNDVIEKTASKLLEHRKNKVKALVGAFETVIDYETAASK